MANKPSISKEEMRERERLEALGSYALMDTPPEQSFDDITQLASAICQTPIALITLVDGQRQWFKSKVGLEETETARADSFCAYTMLESGLTVVEDALQDERFAHSPLVTGDLHIRFYAGAPLLTADGHGLGSLCVIDREPRKLTAQQASALAVLGGVVIKLMEARRSEKRLAKAKAALKQISALLPVCPDCHAIRRDDEYWERVRIYILKHGDKLKASEACLCLSCVAKASGEFK
jgi:GAF domain-containing protein